MGVLAKRKKNRGTNEIPMASTSDVAFLLLVFFIVMPMKQEEIGLSLVLPGKKTKETTVKIKQSHVAELLGDLVSSLSAGIALDESRLEKNKR